MTTSKYISLENSAFFEISGAEKNTFLQGLITNDINKCTENKSIYSAFLSPQGKFIADFFIINLGKSFLFETRTQFLENIINKINFYKLRADIEVKNINNYESFAIYTRDDLYHELKLPGELKKIEKGFVFVDPRKSEMGLKAIIEKDKISDFFLQHSLSKDSFKDYNQKRIENFIPDSLLDLEINKSVLLEYNFDSINAIDWNKGCYVGQEITARMKYRALLKKSLTKISIIDGNVKPHDDIFFDKRSIGSVSSVSKDIGLAILRIDDAKNAFTNDKILETKEGRVKINF